MQLQKVQDDKDLEAPCSSGAQIEEKSHTRLYLNSTAQRKETLRLLNSQLERVGKRREEKGGEEIQPSRTGDIQVGSVDLRYAEMQSGKKKERAEPVSEKEKESCRKLEHLLMMECSNCLDCSSGVDQRFDHGFTFCDSVMDSYVRLPSPPNHHSRKMLISIPMDESDVHPYHVTKTFQNSPRVASSGEERNCSCSELTKTSNNLCTSSTPSNLTSRRSISLLNIIQPEIREKTQRNHSASRQRTPPAPLNQSYDVESPCPTLLRPQISSGSDASETFFRCGLELVSCPQHRINQEHLAASDTLQDKTKG